MPFLLDRQQAEDALRAKGLQPTAQRVEVLFHLHESCQHLSADELHEILVRRFQKVSRATVYNTLKLLVDHGLINEMAIEPGRVLYDPNTDPHFHFFDVDTHELTDVPQELIGITCLPLLPEGMTFQGLDVVVKVSKQR